LCDSLSAKELKKRKKILLPKWLLSQASKWVSI
jgi:hypothetical protein